MTVLNPDDAIARFVTNEDRIDKWVNLNGIYTTNETSSRSVETIPSFMLRHEQQFNAAGSNTQRAADITALLVTAVGTNFTIEVASYHPGWAGTSAGPVGGGTFVWDASKPKSNHNGGTIISPTVPWNGTQANLSAFLAGTGETTPAGNGCWVRADSGMSRFSYFGAIGNGVLDDTASIQKTIDSSNNIFIEKGTYLVTAQINVKADLSITGGAGSKILLKNGVTPYVLRGNSVNNLVLRNVTIEGNGEQGFSTVYITNSTNVEILNCKVTKSGSIGVQIENCTYAKVENCTLSNNYFYGLEFRDCDGCKAIANHCIDNGSTGVATSSGGRGIMLWRSRGCYIAGNRFVTNNEYGFRIYSEAADLTTSYDNVITGNVFIDNTRSDLVLYDEGPTFSFVSRNVISNNIARRTTNTTIGSSFLLHGDFNTYVNNHVIKTGGFGTDTAFNFFNADGCTMIGCYAENMQQGVSTSSSSNIMVENFFGNGVAQGITIPTTGIFVRNSKFLHGGVGASDVCIDNTGATGKNIYDGNLISGFYRGISIADGVVALSGNTTINSTNAGLFKTGNITSTIDAGDNNWDSANPFLLSAYRRTGSTHDQAIIFYPAAPTALTWVRGDVVWNETPAVGSPIGWMCTADGTPGTWTAMANL